MSSMPSFADRVSHLAQNLRYPETPAVAQHLRLKLGQQHKGNTRHLLRFVAAALVVIILAALSVPNVRAQILEFIQVGVIRIFSAPPSSVNDGVPTHIPAVPESPITATPSIGSAPLTTPEYSVSLKGLAGATTLQKARDLVPFEIRLPLHPSDLGEPDRVFIQDNNETVILVWSSPGKPDSVQFSLYEIGSRGVLITKYHPPVIEQTEVNGHAAIWTDGPYLVETTNGDIRWQRMVDGSTLIWEENGITYRLESDLSLEEARIIAESLE